MYNRLCLHFCWQTRSSEAQTAVVWDTAFDMDGRSRMQTYVRWVGSTWSLFKGSETGREVRHVHFEPDVTGDVIHTFCVLESHHNLHCIVSPPNLEVAGNICTNIHHVAVAEVGQQRPLQSDTRYPL